MIEIKEHMEVIGADGVHIGTVDKLKATGLSSPRRTAARGLIKATITTSIEA
jgi:Uncharacterized protein conserved in bacteria (DUF2171)